MSNLFRSDRNPVGRLTRRRLLRMALPAGLVAIALPMAASIAPAGRLASSLPRSTTRVSAPATERTPAVQAAA